MALSRISSARRPAPSTAIALFSLLLLLAAVAAIPAQAAFPGEPTVTVTVAPTEVTVDASGTNSVDTVFKVNVTGNNNFGARPHTMWVNISFSTSSGWAVNPSIANVTLSLPAMGTLNQTVPVTVTV